VKARLLALAANLALFAAAVSPWWGRTWSDGN
jgi:hypothetical protein